MLKVISLLSLLLSCKANEGQFYENYSFDYSAAKMPLAYSTYGNAVELNHKVKLNSVI